MSSLRSAALLIVLPVAVLTGCVTTPVPVPPTVDVDLTTIDIWDDIDTPFIQITGGLGAIDPPDTTIRITTVADDTPPHPSIEIVPNDDGSFTANVELGGRYYLEAITEDDDVFLLAIANGPEGEVISVPAGDDSDDDGSPDVIDCAPEDDRYRGQRCP